METLVKKTTEAVADYLNNLSSDELVNIHNQICQNCNYPDDEIFCNDEEFFKTFFTDPNEAVRASFYGDYRYMDQYVKFNGYGNLDSTNYPESLIDVEAIAENIIEEPENYYLDFEFDEFEE
jgi:hypothetical protein